MEFDIPSREKSIIKVVGVGGGGCNAVSHMYRQGIVGVDFALCNTDHQSMDLSPVPIKIQLGPNLTEGRGAGSKPEVGKKACLESIGEIESFLEDGTKMVFVTAGMGGGTGTGAAPIIAKAARDHGILTVGIVTLPFSFEGKSRILHAEEGIAELTDNVDALIIVSNNKLKEIYGNLRISDAFSHADNILTTAAKGIAEIITVPGYVNVDFEDVNTVMRESGVAIMGIAYGEGEDRAKVAVREALDCPLLEENDIRGAKDILLNIASGTKEITMDEIFEVTEFVQAEAGNDTNLIWGNCYDESLGEQICVTVIATGFNRKKSATSEPGKATTVVQEPIREQTVASTPSVPTPVQRRIKFEVTTGGSPTIVSEDSAEEQTIDTIAGGYNGRGEPFVDDTPSMPRNTSIGQQGFEPSRLDEKKMYAHKNVVELENVPAYKRRRVHLDDPVDSGYDEGPTWNYQQEDDEPEIRRNSPYLHDNVD